MPKSVRLFVSAVLLTASFVPSAVAGLYLPDQISHFRNADACGIRADYTLSGSTLRVELLTAKRGQTINVAARVYQPNSSGPLLRDVWIKSTSLFTLGRFKPARENANGIMEATGDISTSEGDTFHREMSDGDVEISIIFDGVMPTARLPVGLPQPLPEDVINALSECRAKEG